MAFLDDSETAEQQELSFPGQKTPNHRRRRGIYLLPSFLTVGNLLCGYYAVLAVLTGGDLQLDYAARAIGVAILFDSMDGFVARLTGTGSEFGKNFDSLADMVSFGIAPASLAYAWGVRGIARDSAAAVHVIEIAWVVSLLFAICCAWRLARFNVQGMGGGMRFFIGMPCPAAAGMIAATVHAFKYPLESWHWSVLFFLLVTSLALLMTSRVRYMSFKNINWSRRQPSLIIVAIGILAWSVVVYSEVVLLAIAGFYTFAGIIMQIVRWTRRHPSADAQA